MPEFWEGIDKVVSNAKAAKAAKNRGGIRALGIALQNILNVSNRQVPHELGDLERDGAWSLDEEKLKGAVSYGRSAHTAPYAVPQHEHMDWQHDEGRSAKFLEHAMNSTRAQNAQILANAIKDEMGVGGK